jgi:hypothetical protein
MSDSPRFHPDWEPDCLKWRGVVLTGKYAHWCMEYDELPVDETCFEWPCGCQEWLDKEIAERGEC